MTEGQHTAGHQVVVPVDATDAAGLHQRQSLAGEAVVADQVAQVDDVVDAAGVDVGEHGR